MSIPPQVSLLLMLSLTALQGTLSLHSLLPWPVPPKKDGREGVRHPPQQLGAAALRVGWDKHNTACLQEQLSPETWDCLGSGTTIHPQAGNTLVPVLPSSPVSTPETRNISAQRWDQDQARMLRGSGPSWSDW